MKPQSRIDPDYNPNEEQLNDLMRLVAEATAKHTVHVQGYHESSGDARPWIVTIGSGLILAFITGGYLLSNQVASLQTEVANLKMEVADLKRMIEPRLREK